MRTVAALLALGVCGSALATSSVSFEAQGYLLDFVVGSDGGRPSIAGLSFAAPAGVAGVEISMRHLEVVTFDTQHKILLLRFTNPGDTKLPQNFSLTIRNDTGVLRIGGKSFAGRFSWGM